MKTEAKKSRKSFKGAVLFTILVVMTILITLMITTIGLASAATKRSYYEYNERQTTSTARSLVDTVVQALGSTNRNMGQSIIDSLRANPSSTVVVNVNGDGTLGEGFGVVDSLEFSLVGKDTTGAGNFYLRGTGDDIIKITATVTQGGVTSTYSQYVIGDKSGGNNRSSGGGFVAFGGFNGDTSDGPSVFAPAYVNIDPTVPDGSGGTRAKTLEETVNENYNFFNDSVNKGVLINSSASMNAGGKWNLSGGDGLTIVGNFDTMTNELEITTDVTLNSTNTVSDLPYVYVGGTFWVQKPIVYDPINIYCGRIVYGRNDGNLAANIFCYNPPKAGETRIDAGTAYTHSTTAYEDFDKSWSFIGNTNSKLIDWVSGLSESERNSLSAVKTGNVYTMGNLYLNENFSIPGDLFVNGDLYLNSVRGSIGGDVYVNGKIEYNDETSRNNFVNSIQTGKTVFYNDGLVAEDIKTQLGGKGSAISEDKYSSVIKDFLTGKLTKANVEIDIADTPAAALESFTDEVNGVKHRKDAVNISQCDVAAAKVYTGKNSGQLWMYSAGDTTGTQLDLSTTGGTIPGTSDAYSCRITDGCTLSGNFQNIVLYFEPTTDIWVNLYKVYMSNCKIIVNDEKGRVNFYMIDTDNYSGNTKTSNKYEIENFYQNNDYEATLKAITGSDFGAEVVKTEEIYWPVRETKTAKYKNTFEMASAHTDFMTLKYYQEFKAGHKLELVTDPKSDTDPDNNWMVPGIAIYSAENSSVYMGFDNNSTYTGDIYLPSGTFYKGSGGSDTAKASEVTWNGEAVVGSDDSIQWVGSLVVNTIKSIDNKLKLAYVDDPLGGAPIVSSSTAYKWDPIGGYADY